MSIDRMSNMLSTLKNAAMARKAHVEVVHTKECEGVAKILKSKGFIEGVKVFKVEDRPNKMLGLDLAHTGDLFEVTDVRRVSKPGNRKYLSTKKLYKVAGGRGCLIISTSRGLMAGEDARKKKLGGEVLCEVF